MTTDQIAVLGVIIGTFALFAWNRWRHDVVAVTSLVALTLADLAALQESPIQERAAENFGEEYKVFLKEIGIDCSAPSYP